MAREAPGKKAQARDDEYRADDVTLLGFDLVLEPQPHECHGAGQGDRDEDVAARRKAAHPGEPDHAPPLGPCHNRQGNPVVGKDRVDQCERRSPQDQHHSRRNVHGFMLPDRAPVTEVEDRRSSATTIGVRWGSCSRDSGRAAVSRWVGMPMRRAEGATLPRTERPKPRPKKGSAYDIVAIASSAGGVTAMTNLVAALPADFGAIVLCVQHLDPRHRSLMAEVIGRRSKLPVVQAADAMKVEKSHVYLAPPDR